MSESSMLDCLSRADRLRQTSDDDTRSVPSVAVHYQQSPQINPSQSFRVQLLQSSKRKHAIIATAEAYACLLRRAAEAHNACI